jgi:hypothetical protein
MLGRFGIIPAPVRTLTGATVFHGFLRHGEIQGGSCHRSRSGQHRRAQHVRVVNGTLIERHVAQADAGVGPFCGKPHDPVARTDRDIQVPAIPEDFVGVQKGMADETCPDNDGFTFLQSSAPACIIEMIPPAVFRVSGRFVLIQPVKAGTRPFPVGRVSAEPQHFQIPSGHVASAFRGVLRPDSQKGRRLNGD